MWPCFCQWIYLFSLKFLNNLRYIIQGEIGIFRLSTVLSVNLSNSTYGIANQTLRHIFNVRMVSVFLRKPIKLKITVSQINTKLSHLRQESIALRQNFKAIQWNRFVDFREIPGNKKYQDWTMTLNGRNTLIGKIMMTHWLEFRFYLQISFVIVI